MDGGSGSIDGGGGGGTGFGGTTGGNPIIPVLGCSNNPNAYVECLSLYFSTGVDIGFGSTCSSLRVQNAGLDLLTGVLTLSISGFGVSCSAISFTSGIYNPTFRLAVGTTGVSAEVKNARDRFSTDSGDIDFTVVGRGVAENGAVKYTVDFRPALLRLQTVGSAGRSGTTTARQIEIDLGGTDGPGSKVGDARYSTIP